MKLGLRRPVKAYFFRAVWISIVISWLITNSTDFGRWIIGLLLALGTVSFVNAIVRRNYFEIDGDELKINRDFFVTRKINLSEIERVNIEPGPFTSSTIVLKDRSVVKYMDSQLDDVELKKVFGQLEIQVG